MESGAAFSLEDFCQQYLENPTGDPWTNLAESSRAFLQSLKLSSVPPHCLENAAPFPSNVPPMGPLLDYSHHDSILDAIVTVWHQVAPALLAMGELWLRLFASLLAPLCVAHLLWEQLNPLGSKAKPNERSRRCGVVTISCLLAVTSSVVLTTDELYVLQYGPSYGLYWLMLSTTLSLWECICHRLNLLAACVVALVGLAVHLVYQPESGDLVFGGPNVPRNISEGLYYNVHNPIVKNIVDGWPQELRTYSVEYGATRWMPTGDSRTGLPFLLNHVESPTWTRVWLPTVDEEVVALDFSFPVHGHDLTNPVYLVLHGLNGGSGEEYVMNLANRRNADGCTVVVMVARGLMDLPVIGWNVFHGARVDDVHAAAKVLRPALGANQVLVGVGFSMGAIVLNNYVARSGPDCALDAAITISGGLDMMPQLRVERAMRLWQPMLAQELREKFVIGKFGERYKERLTRKQMLELMRATHITSIDEHGVVTYNSFRDLEHYYSEMSAMGFSSLAESDLGVIPADSRIHNISIPLCVVHALDDPLVTWMTVAADSGPKHPSNLVSTGNGNLLVLLTKAGGHVGWPLGWNPRAHQWNWMVDAAKGFVESVAQTKRNSPQASNSL